MLQQHSYNYGCNKMKGFHGYPRMFLFSLGVLAQGRGYGCTTVRTTMCIMKTAQLSRPVPCSLLTQKHVIYLPNIATLCVCSGNSARFLNTVRAQSIPLHSKHIREENCSSHW